MQGWIKLHRELTEKAIWLESTPEQKVILITLLMMANHKEKQWEFKGEKYEAKAGQFVTSLDSIVKKSGAGISIKNVRTALKRFEKYGFLANESTNKNRLITIVNWEVYQQSDDEAASKRASNGQATGKRVATNKNDKNAKNEKKYSPKQVYDESSLYYQLANYFLGEIRKNNPDHKAPNMQTWSDDIRKMMELDNRNEEQIRYLMQWVQADDFEMANVLSPSKLRKRFDQLVIKVKSEKRPATIKSVELEKPKSQLRHEQEMRELGLYK